MICSEISFAKPPAQQPPPAIQPMPQPYRPVRPYPRRYDPRRQEPKAPQKEQKSKWEVTPSIEAGFQQRNSTSSNHGLTRDYGTSDEKTAGAGIAAKYLIPARHAPGENISIGASARGKYGDVANTGKIYKFESSSLDEGNVAATASEKPDTTSFYGDLGLSPELILPLDEMFQLRFFGDFGNRFDKMKTENKTQTMSGGGEFQMKTASKFKAVGRASQKQTSYPSGPVPKGPLNSTNLELRLSQELNPTVSFSGGVAHSEQKLPGDQVLAASSYGAEATTKYDLGGSLKGPFGLELNLSGSYAQLTNYTVTDLVHPTQKNAAGESLIVNVTAQATKVGYLGEIKFAPVDWVNAKVSYEYSSSTFNVPDPDLVEPFQRVTPNFSTVTIYSINLVKKF